MPGDLLGRFTDLHESGHFVIPNPWDVGSAKLMESVGFEALATTSSGLAASLGKSDQQVTLDELLSHVAAVTRAVNVPLSVDAEFGFSQESSGLSDVVEQIVECGAVGMSIEDYMPGRGVISHEEATERVGAVVEAAAGRLVITARAENHLYGIDDLDDTISRLRSFAGAGADVVYAPFLRDPDAFARLVDEIPKPVNALLLPNGPSVGDLAAAGVRRMSVGGGMAFSAYGMLEKAANELLDSGTSSYRTVSVSPELLRKTFGPSV